jgi:four helix bundle protein
MRDPSIKSHRELQSWQAAMSLAAACHKLVSGLPPHEPVAIEIVGSAMAVPTAIALGFEQDTSAGYVQHLREACGKIARLESGLMLARTVQLIDVAKADARIAECEKLAKLVRNQIRAVK